MFFFFSCFRVRNLKGLVNCVIVLYPNHQFHFDLVICHTYLWAPWIANVPFLSCRLYCKLTCKYLNAVSYLACAVQLSLNIAVLNFIKCHIFRTILPLGYYSNAIKATFFFSRNFSARILYHTIHNINCASTGEVAKCRK